MSNSGEYTVAIRCPALTCSPVKVMNNFSILPGNLAVSEAFSRSSAWSLPESSSSFFVWAPPTTRVCTCAKAMASSVIWSACGLLLPADSWSAGIRSMPQMGQSPDSGSLIWGCIEQVQMEGRPSPCSCVCASVSAEVIARKPHPRTSPTTKISASWAILVEKIFFMACSD